MNNFFRIIATSLVAASAFVPLCSCGSDNEPSEKVDDLSATYEVVPYVWSDGDLLPDPALVTGMTYIGNTINDTRDGFDIRNEARFNQLLNLKKTNPNLKVYFCIGGTCKSGFTTLAGNPEKREAFAEQCAKLIKERGVDGIDFDWEFPGWEGGSSADGDNYVLLLKAVREKIGADKNLTVCVGNNVDGFDVIEALKVADYLNVMTYDMGSGEAHTHHTSLRRSHLSGYTTVEEAIARYVKKGVPYDRMMLGLAFYGRGNNKEFKDWTDYRYITPGEGMTEKWDDVACVPYITNSDGELVISYENPRSIAIKCDYIKEKGFRGAMIWRTEYDTDDYVMAHAVADGLLAK